MDVTNSTPQKPLIFEQAPVSKPEEKTENLTPEEIEQARNIVSNFKDTDSSNENKVEELQRALVIL
ncbi:MAG: hypothetical protein LBC61_00955 [Candidatus Peribacteria bacterium]|jgi:hypothetical protein|nr:hypothetical protein [Candidatus Peribacteria bacterium]